MAKNKRSSVGLTENGRINWVDPVNSVIIELADSGLYGRVIADCTGLTVGQVYTRCHMLGISLKDFRSGKSDKALAIINKYDVAHDKASDKAIRAAEKQTHKALRLSGYKLFEDD